MNSDTRYRKQIMFDLDTKVCEQILGKKYRRIYEDLEKFLKSNGFIHPQGSGYISSEKLSNSEIFLLTQKLLKEYPYLTKCVRDIRTADIIEVNSINHYFEYDGTAGKFAQKENDKQQESQERKETIPAKKMSLKSAVNHKKEVVEQRQANRQPHNPHKSSEYER